MQAFNPFGDGAVNDPALIERLRGGLAVRTRYDVWSAAARADGIVSRAFGSRSWTRSSMPTSVEDASKPWGPILQLPP